MIFTSIYEEAEEKMQRALNAKKNKFITFYELNYCIDNIRKETKKKQLEKLEELKNNKKISTKEYDQIKKEIKKGAR